MKKSLIVMILMGFVLASCVQKKPEEMYEEQRTGVVMVLNKFYYEMKLPNGAVFYFTGLDENGGLVGLTENEEQAKAQPGMSFGTAFFIDEKGSLLTNRHVASPPINKEMVKKYFTAMVENAQRYALAYMQRLQQIYQQAVAEGSEIVGYDEYGNLVTTDADRLQQLQNGIEEVQSEFEKAKESYMAFEQIKNPSDIVITPICELGIAYDGSSPKSDADFLKKAPCTVVRTSGDEEVDLALLKLKSGVTPSDAYVFDVNAADDNLKIGDDLYMIGYNAGMEIAYTKNGVNSQFTKGAVTQRPDGQRVLYDIATIQGSSGSPVMNSKGQVVAVNFAKFAKSDNFNLGVPLRAIRKFLK